MAREGWPMPSTGRRKAVDDDEESARNVSCHPRMFVLSIGVFVHMTCFFIKLLIQVLNYGGRVALSKIRQGSFEPKQF